MWAIDKKQEIERGRAQGERDWHVEAMIQW